MKQPLCTFNVGDIVKITETRLVGEPHEVSYTITKKDRSNIYMTQYGGAVDIEVMYDGLRNEAELVIPAHVPVDKDYLYPAPLPEGFYPATKTRKAIQTIYGD